MNAPHLRAVNVHGRVERGAARVVGLVLEQGGACCTRLCGVRVEMSEALIPCVWVTYFVRRHVFKVFR